MKLYRNAVILVVVLGLLVGAYFFINNKNKANSDVSDITDTDDTIYVLKSEQEYITSLEYDNKLGTFTLKKNGEEWTMEPASEFPVDNLIADASATDMSAVIAERVIEENAADLSVYGLDKPTTIKVGMADGSSQVLEVGSTSPTNEGIYVKKKGESKVYLVSSYYLSKLNLSRGYFASKEILPVEATTLKTFSYEKNGEMALALDIKSESEMKITAPYKEDAEVSVVTPILQSVVQLSISEVIDDNPADLAKYGLDKPAFIIEYGDASTTKKILFGKYLEKGTIIYAKFADGKSVFTVDVSSLTFLDIKFSEVINPFIFIPNINDVNKVDLFIDGKNIISEIVTNPDNKEEDKFKVDGKDANMKNESDKSLFRNFYQAIIGLTLNKYEPEAKPTGTPEISIKYYMKTDSNPVIIDFISKDKNYYYAMKNGVYTNRVILKSKFDTEDGIRNTYKILKNAIDEAK